MFAKPHSRVTSLCTTVIMVLCGRVRTCCGHGMATCSKTGHMCPSAALLSAHVAVSPISSLTPGRNIVAMRRCVLFINAGGDLWLTDHLVAVPSSLALSIVTCACETPRCSWTASAASTAVNPGCSLPNAVSGTMLFGCTSSCVAAGSYYVMSFGILSPRVVSRVVHRPTSTAVPLASETCFAFITPLISRCLAN